LTQALQRLNPQVPADAIEEAFRKLPRPDSPSLVAANRVIHKYLVDGVPVEFQRPDGSLGGDLVRVFNYDNVDDNEFLAVKQFTAVEDRHERRPDVVLFVNGLPLAVIEL
jgi:type I restriction enzyme R subunit